MKKLNVVIFVVIMIALTNNVYGTTNDNQLIDVYEEFISNMDNIYSSIKIDSTELKGVLQQPLNLFYIFLKAFIIVILINVISKIICKFCFNSSSIISKRYKARKLDKTLKRIYPTNKRIYD